MKKTALVFVLFLSFSSYAQNSSKESWSFGLGLSNFTMQGDLTSLGTGFSDNNNSLFNVGTYIYADKMFSPVFGLELKAHFTKIGGAAQELSTGFNVGGTSLRDTRFEGNAFGAEINTILNFSSIISSPYQTRKRKWNVAGYLGWGIQTYDSKLIDTTTDEVIVDFGSGGNTAKNGDVSSNYYTVALGLKYKINDKFDVEFRPSLNINEEDHLDAAVVDKQGLEVFFQTNLGIVFKLNDEGRDNFVWQDNNGGNQIIEAKEQDVNVEIENSIKELFRDTDGDGVIDRLDKELNSEPGAVVYGNGVTIDSDKDGIPDFKDDCPTVFARTKDGCPRDTDGDGVLDSVDLCPDIKGDKNNGGCPILEDAQNTIDMTQIVNLSERIYFELDSFVIKGQSKPDLDEIAAIMIEYPETRFMVEGHTDLGGKRAYNQKLSENRANAVLEYLISKGVKSSNLERVGYGFTRPKYDNENVDLRTKNRRVDIKLIKDIRDKD